MAEEKSPIPISAIGEIRGFFEIFLPGLFVLGHLVFLVFCLAPVQSDPYRFLQAMTRRGASTLIMGIPAAYVIGLALRLSRTARADAASGKAVAWTARGRRFLGLGPTTAYATGSERNQPIRDEETEVQRDGNSAGGPASTGDNKTPVHADSEPANVPTSGIEEFPYSTLVGKRIGTHLPATAREYYGSLCAEPGSRALSHCGFDFWKTLVGALDERTAGEIYRAEVFVRHAASMCYALTTSLALVFLGFWGGFATGAHDHWFFLTLVLPVFVGELVLLGVLLRNLRYLRVAEVETVFTLCFRHRHELQRLVDEERLQQPPPTCIDE